MARLLAFFAMAFLVAHATSAAKPQGEPTLRVTFRVTTTRPQGRLVIDRGTSDRIEIGDVCFVLPREGGRLRGKVAQVEARSAVVQLDDPQASVIAGTRGEFRIPTKRFATPQKRTKDDGATKPDVGEKTKVDTKSRRWKNRDEDWKPGMPLLSRVRPVRPENRAWKMSGRAYATTLLSRHSSAGSENSYLRTGADLVYDNLFGAGGEFRIDAELNNKVEQTDLRGSDLLFRRLSYVYGGTRFERQRIGVGRFLHSEVPEFGVLDGVAWSQRLEGGDRVGASIGFLPVPDDDFESFSDLQIAGFYRWVADERELFTLTAGFQKTFHSGHSDRDLLVGKVQMLPENDGWDLNGSFWIDLYTGNDSAKKHDIELTQALVSLGRRYDDGSGIDIIWWHQQFPDLLRRQNRFITPNRLRVDRHDRLTLSGWMPWAEDARVRGSVFGWTDEDENGGGAEVGVDVDEVFFEGGRSGFVLLANAAIHESTFGARFTTGRTTATGRWDAWYDFAYHHRTGFPSDFADIIQHRVFGQHEFALQGSWDLSTWIDANLWDGDASYAIGFYVQKRF